MYLKLASSRLIVLQHKKTKLEIIFCNTTDALDSLFHLSRAMYHVPESNRAGTCHVSRFQTYVKTCWVS